ncbi:MAG: DUF5698 domain-containing protein [Methanomicrobiales archaeon]
MVDSVLTSPVFGFVVLPILIFCARVCDINLDTIRVIFMSKWIKYRPAIIGFFERFIGLAATGQVIDNLTNVVCYIAYGSRVSHRYDCRYGN